MSVLCFNFIGLLSYTPINFIENVSQGAKDIFSAKLKKIQNLKCKAKRVLFFVESSFVPILYNKLCICIGDQYLWKILFRLE